MNNTISEDVLRGIVEALTIHAPHLLPKIHMLGPGGVIHVPEFKRGNSTYAKLSNTISWEDAEPVLRALEAIEQEYGYQKLFAGRQINFLVVSWRNFSEPRQLPSQNNGPA